MADNSCAQNANALISGKGCAKNNCKINERTRIPNVHQMIGRVTSRAITPVAKPRSKKQQSNPNCCSPKTNELNCNFHAPILRGSTIHCNADEIAKRDVRYAKLRNQAPDSWGLQIFRPLRSFQFVPLARENWVLAAPFVV